MLDVYCSLRCPRTRYTVTVGVLTTEQTVLKGVKLTRARLRVRRVLNVVNSEQ